ERGIAKEQVEYGLARAGAVVPVRISHGQLVQIGQQRRGVAVELPYYGHGHESMTALISMRAFGRGFNHVHQYQYNGAFRHETDHPDNKELHEETTPAGCRCTLEETPVDGSGRVGRNGLCLAVAADLSHSGDRGRAASG